MTARSSRTPPDPWSIAWRAALGAVGIDEERPTAELIAIGAVARFRLTPHAPGAKALRNAGVDVPAAARQLAKGLSTYQSAALTTPVEQAERYAALGALARDLATEFRLDPDGPTGLHLSILGAPHQLALAAGRAERRIKQAQLEQLPPAPPRAPRPMFDRLMADLGAAYRATTGREPSAATNGLGFTPPFVRFVNALWPQAADRPRPGPGAIAGALRRINSIADVEQPKADGIARSSTGGTGVSP